MTTFFKIIRYKMYSNRVLYVTLQPKRWTFPISRVVYRGYNNANANVGSRLDKLITLSIGLPYKGRAP